MIEDETTRSDPAKILRAPSGSFTPFAKQNTLPLIELRRLG